MKITVIGAGNSGLAMAAHLQSSGNQVILWNRNSKNIGKLLETKTIFCKGVINQSVEISYVTSDLGFAVNNSDIIFITTPSSSHKELASRIAQVLKKSTMVVLSPGRTFGIIEFMKEFEGNNKYKKVLVAETQTIIYTCRKISEDEVSLIAFKKDIYIASNNKHNTEIIIDNLPNCIKSFFRPANSFIETSLGNVGMILHCAPMLMNVGWIESKSNSYKFYYDGISKTVASYLEKIDMERVEVAKKLGYEIETTTEWMRRVYSIDGFNLYECTHNNIAYSNIDAPSTMEHRYIFEDIPCGLVPMEYIGNMLQIDMKYTKMIIDLACLMLDHDFRGDGRRISIDDIKGKGY